MTAISRGINDIRNDINRLRNLNEQINQTPSGKKAKNGMLVKPILINERNHLQEKVTAAFKAITNLGVSLGTLGTEFNDVIRKSEQQIQTNNKLIQVKDKAKKKIDEVKVATKELNAELRKEVKAKKELLRLETELKRIPGSPRLNDAAAHIPAPASKCNTGLVLGLSSLAVAAAAVGYKYFTPIKEAFLSAANTASANWNNFATSYSSNSTSNTTSLATFSQLKSSASSGMHQAIATVNSTVTPFLSSGMTYGKTLINEGGKIISNSTGIVEGASKFATIAKAAYPFTAGQSLFILGTIITVGSAIKYFCDCCKPRAEQPVAPQQAQANDPDYTPELTGDLFS